MSGNNTNIYNVYQYDKQILYQFIEFVNGFSVYKGHLREPTENTP